MFADNWKISLRQVRRLLILDIFGLSSLMLPGILSSLTGADGVFCLVLGAAGGWAQPASSRSASSAGRNLRLRAAVC